METCSICGKRYEVDTDNEYFLDEELPICSRCGEKLDFYFYSESADSYETARKFLEKKCSEAVNPNVKAALKQLLSEARDEEDEPAEPTLVQNWKQASSFSAGSGEKLPYVVYQVTLREKFVGTGSGNLEELESVLNHFYNMGYRLHTMSTATSISQGFGGGDRIQATLVFEKRDLFGDTAPSSTSLS